MTDRQTLSILLTARQYEMWEFKKNYKEKCGFFPSNAEIAIFMGIKQPAVSRLQKRISEKLSKC